MKPRFYFIGSVFIYLSQTVAWADHPAYLHALSDLRLSRAYLESGYIGERDYDAIDKIDRAFNEIRQASIDDGKNLNDHPPIDTGLGGDRFRRARELLEKAHNDIVQDEDNGWANHLRDRALQDIDIARKEVHEIELHQEWWEAGGPVSVSTGEDVSYDFSTSDPVIDYTPFYQSLANQGTWLDLPNYGYVFQPSVVEADWAPYTNGSWAYTDAGWTWVSSEPWGWATYHYGRWLYVNQPNVVGWVWIPGNTWAPAWVSWRHGVSQGRSYYGWAPLPPEPINTRNSSGGVNLVIGANVDLTLNIRPQFYRFLPEKFLGATSYKPYYVPLSRNTDLVKVSVNLTNINVNRKASSTDPLHRVFAGGPALKDIHPSHPIAQFHLAASSSPTTPGARGFYAPTFAHRTPATPRPAPVGDSNPRVFTPRPDTEPKTTATGQKPSTGPQYVPVDERTTQIDEKKAVLKANKENAARQKPSPTPSY